MAATSTPNAPLRIVGLHGSPSSRKPLAALRDPARRLRPTDPVVTLSTGSGCSPLFDPAL